MTAVPDESMKYLADVFALLLEVEFRESFTLKRCF